MAYGPKYWIRWDNGTVEFLSDEELWREYGTQVIPNPPIADFVHPIRTFHRLPLDPGPPVIGGGILPQGGKLLIYGSQKVGKSYLALQLALCAAEGMPFLGYKGEVTKSLYLQFEIAPAQLQDRIKKPWDNSYIGTTFSLKLGTRDGKEKVREVLDKTRPGLVILDPLYKLCRGSVNDDDEVQYTLDAVDEVIIGEYQAACIIFHHENRGGSLRGSGRMFEWPDSIAQFKKVSGQSYSHELRWEFMRHTKEPPEPIALTFSEEDFLFHPYDARSWQKRVEDDVSSGMSWEEVREKYTMLDPATFRQIKKRVHKP